MNALTRNYRKAEFESLDRTADQYMPSMTPWLRDSIVGHVELYDKEGFKIAEIKHDSGVYKIDEANAELIVRCVNGHEALVEACKAQERIVMVASG